MILETPRLRLAWATRDDVEPIVALWTDAEATRYLAGPRDATKLRTLLDGIVARSDAERVGELAFSARETAGGAYVGDFQLVRKDVDGIAEIEIVYVVVRSRWGMGFATEGARALLDHPALAARGAIALIDPANRASARVAEKIGMRLEGMTIRPNGRTLAVYRASAVRQREA